MKNMQLKLLVLCMAISGSLGAMDSKKKLVTVLVKAHYGTTFEQQIPIDCDTKDKDHYLQQVSKYFGFGSKDIREGQYLIGQNQSWIEIDGYEFNRLNMKKNESIWSLWGNSAEKIDVNILNQQAEYATRTEFNKSCFQESVKRFVDRDLSGSGIYFTLLHLDKVKRVIESDRDITPKCKDLWKDFIKQVDAQINNIIDQQLLKLLLIDQNAVPPEYRDAVQAGIHGILVGHMQLLKYALEYARKDSAQHSRIIGPWFEQKIASLKPEELDLVIQNVQLWLAHYQPIEKHFMQMRYGISSSWINKAVLKKMGIGLCLFGLGVAASQLYQHMYGTQAHEENTTA